MAIADRAIDLNVTIDDKYVLDRGRVFLSGTQALVRLPMMQHRRDVQNGINSACYISGYRGSPLGSYDQQLWLARRHLEAENIKFQPGINEDLAVTAIWGTQQLNLIGSAKVDGVFSIFYGKGPGIDRSGDALRHANLAGTDPKGGVLALAGDDHTCKSSTTAHASEYALVDAMIPILHPAGVQEILDFGLHGIAMSRYSGAWASLKLIAETVESAASVYVDPDRVAPIMPSLDDFTPPPGGLHIRYPHTALDQEELLHRHKPAAAQAYVKANKLDRLVVDAPKRRLGIVTCGKSFLDVEQALADLGLDHDRAASMGLSVYKLALTWPVEPDGLMRFARDHDELFVVEEKRPLIEDQLKRILYNLPADQRPRIVGKTDETGAPLLPSYNELSPVQVARAIAGRLANLDGGNNTDIDERVARLDRLTDDAARQASPLERLPYFCSGCPHNTSTVVPEGSRALVGIGCHYMAQWMDRKSALHTHMGAEGANWIGQAPFSDTPHIFANIGDGTYQHSGSMAIRAAIASGATMTYKILFNDAVALTGGQPMDGNLTVPAIAHQLSGEGASKIVVVAEEPEKYGSGSMLPGGTKIHHRDDLDIVQRNLREVPGVSVLIFDQTCAAEKRRRRKRNAYPDPPKRAFINKAVCEGCGDCSAKSNCLSVVPVETPLGRKREIDQSACNKDFSCVKGFCPSFVTVHGGTMRKGETAASENTPDFDAIPEPKVANCNDRPYNVLVTGVGGTGVLTIGNVLGMAAHLEGKGCTVLDMSGLAQKFGPVMSHVRIGRDPAAMNAISIATGSADLLLGCDIVVGAGKAAVTRLSPGRSQAVVNTHPSITGDFTRNPDQTFPADDLRAVIGKAVGSDAVSFIDSTRIATALLGDAIAANLFLLGVAYQKGLVPVSAEAINRAIELNGVALAMNHAAFLWGRFAVYDPARLEKIVPPPTIPVEPRLEDIVRERIEDLKAYQDDAYARRYKDLIVRVQTVESALTPQSDALSSTVARAYHKLLAYKDEYDVARLYTDGRFEEELRSRFTGDYTLQFHLAPPLLTGIDPETGERSKRAFGSWMMHAFRLLAKFKSIRGTRWDLFGYQAERQRERQMIADYEAMIGEMLDGLTRDNLPTAMELAALPEKYRGFGHVKDRNIQAAEPANHRLMARFKKSDQTVIASAAE